MRRSIPLVVALLSVAAPASASVVEHHVTPDNVAATDGIDVTVVRRRGDRIVLRLTVDRASVAVYPPVVRDGDGAPGRRVPFDDPDADPLVVEVELRGSDAVVTVMRDFGLVGHSYQIRARDWAAP